MQLAGVKIGFALTGSHCSLAGTLPQLKQLIDLGAEVYPIISDSINKTDTRFGTVESWKEQVETITGHSCITTIVQAEPIGPQNLLDVVIVAPCTGNTISKLANGITDSPVLMAIKAHLRNQKPVVLAVSTNDGLSMNAKNIGILLNSKNIYFVPLGQDDPGVKSNSLVAHMNLIPDTIELALKGKQLQPILRPFAAARPS